MLEEITNGKPDLARTWPPQKDDDSPAAQTYRLYKIHRGEEYPCPTVSLTNEEVVERLRKLIIRHTKSMRIGGEVALGACARRGGTDSLRASLCPTTPPADR